MSDLERVWRAKTDDDLAKAAGRLFEYTAAGERCIRDELKRRGLPEPLAPVGYCTHCGRSIAWNHPDTRCSECGTPFSPDIVERLNPPTGEDELPDEPRAVFVGTGEAEARQVQAFLEAAGIVCAIRGEAFGRIYGLTVDGLGAVSVIVAGCDEDRARALIQAAESGQLRIPDNVDPDGE